MSNSLDPTKRFSSRVEDYIKYRPDYPRQVVRLLQEKIAFASDWRVADIGCGTGISSRLFLENGNEVAGVEPNDDMRAAAEREFAGQPRFRAVKGAAEATNLPDAAVDLIVAAQAFHWFDHAACAIEWKRILRDTPGGWALLMWNTRLIATGAFAADYDQLLRRYGTDYDKVAHRSLMSLEQLGSIFGVSFERLTLANHQSFTFDDLCGRVRSSSYTPLPGQKGHDELFQRLRELFDHYQEAGIVRFDYETELFLAPLCNRNSKI